MNRPSCDPQPVTESPCIGVCTMGGSVCLGCGRTLDQIALWPDLSPSARRVIVEELTARKAGPARDSLI